jgi:hypothetical protein
MPNSIADLIFSQMQTAGKPRTTTQQTTGTQTLKQQSPLDVGSLGLLLYLMLSGQKKTSLGTTAAPAATNLTSLIGQAPGTMTSQDPISLIMSMLGGMGSLGGSSGLR